MSDIAAGMTLDELLRAFAGAPAASEEEYRCLVAAVWSGGRPTEGAAAAVAPVLSWLSDVEETKAGRLLVLLGLLIEAEAKELGVGGFALGGPVHAAASNGVDRYLELLDGRRGSDPTTLAAIYLLSHFPQERERILAAVPHDLEPDDRSRLECSLTVLDPADPGAVPLGRSWPSPAEWTTLTEEDRAFDRSWIAELTPEQVAKRWSDDIVMVLTYSGGKAHWALRHGRPTTVVDTSEHRDATALPAPEPAGAELFSPHEETFRCPDCAGRLMVDDPDVRCGGCGTTYTITDGILDLMPKGSSLFGGADHAMQRAASMARVGHYYETVARPGFFRLVGSNWGGAITPEDEDRYLVERLGQVDGTVLDLGAGAGRWTTVLAEAVGADRLIALDPNPVMLSWLRRRSPDVACLQASALTLPFADASLGAVNCWNALQAMPDPVAALAEVARCLRPGGVLTLMTYVLSPDPVYRYFQTTSSWPGHPDGLELHEFDRIRGWLVEAGFAVQEHDTSGTLLTLTARLAS